MSGQPRTEPLLTRDKFREAVFARDKHLCVFGGEPAVDAHHIMERRLFPDGGYYLSNGASVCEAHHLACERTLISVNEVRQACGIETVILPPHLYVDADYDKWGNIVMPNGMRLKGDLFFDASVQKALAEGGVLPLFSDRVKYPRSFHAPFSPGMTKDDRAISSFSSFMGKRVVITEKMDGENTTLYFDGHHARSIETVNHASRHWLKVFHARICGDIPQGWRICGENMYAKHTIFYDDLASYFYGFSMWSPENICLSWDETVEWFELLGVVPVPTLYDGIFDEQLLHEIHQPTRNGRESEGWVMRIADAFPYGAFRQSLAKYVRKGHVTEAAHWMHGRLVVPNRLAPGISAY